MNISELDYYNILNVPRNSTKQAIAMAYRKLAIKLCPLRRQNARHLQMFVQPLPEAQENEKTHMSPLSLNRQWAYINMAYDVLGNDLHRSIYDRFGEAGLLKGIFLPTTGYFPPYNYHGNHMKVYHDVFGCYSPYADVIDAIVGTNCLPLYTNKSQGIGVKTKDPPVIKPVGLDLEEVHSGCIKLMHVWRQEFKDVNHLSTEKTRKTLTLSIEPGVTAGTRFCFHEEGDRCPTTIPSDIIFVVEDKPHDRFKRWNQHDLVYSHEISLCQALTGFKFSIQTLDKRQLNISITDVVYPGYSKIIPGEGLPKCKAKAKSAAEPNEVLTNNCGDLIIEFSVDFPRYLTTDMKVLARTFFAQLDEMAEQEIRPPDGIKKCGPK